MWIIVAACILIIGIACAYATIFCVLRQPCVQRKLIYASIFKFPLFLVPLDYSTEGVHRHTTLQTPDGETLGAWIYYKDIDYKTTDRVVLYLHGNAGTRGQGRRYRLYEVLSKIFRAQVFCFDYRGFGDSTGTPTEDTVLIDAITAWNYVVETRGASKVIVWGHSLGTGIGNRLAEVISQSDNVTDETLLPFVNMLAPDSKEKFKGLFLEAPFESIETAAQTHYFGAFLWVFPKTIRDYIMRNIICVCDRLESIKRIRSIAVPIMIMHASNDWIISVQQGINLATYLCPALRQPAKPTNVNVTSGTTPFNKPCRLAVFPSGGHNNLGTHPEFNSVVTSFKEQLEGFED